jgi:hypothetical protein
MPIAERQKQIDELDDTADRTARREVEEQEKEDLRAGTY